MESYAIDLSWDIISRYGQQYDMPDEFFEDWLKVAHDESRHFRMLRSRLIELGSDYGKLPAHSGLWDSAISTKDDLLARLVILHCVHEARGLDTTPKNVQRLKSSGDKKSGKILDFIYREEISHVTFGVKWVNFMCDKLYKKEDKDSTSVEKDEAIKTKSEFVTATFRDVTKKYFRNPLKPPFNDEARSIAGMPKEWYLPDEMI